MTCAIPLHSARHEDMVGSAGVKFGGACRAQRNGFSFAFVFIHDRMPPGVVRDVSAAL